MKKQKLEDTESSKPQKSRKRGLATDNETTNNKAVKIGTSSHAAKADTSKPKTDENITEKHTGKRRGRRPSPERRDAIRVAISKHGDQWRDHLYEILAELDDQRAPLGDFLGMKIDLCDGHVILVKEWVDLDSADGDQRGRIVDALRKYL